MPTKLPRKGGILLVSGLDVSRPAEYIGDQSSPDVLNFFVDRNLLVKRYGLTARGGVIGGTDLRIMAGTEFTREGTKYNVRISQDKIEHYNSGAGTWTDITGTDLAGADDDLVSTAVPLLSGKRILTFTNGLEVRKWNGTGNTAALGGTPPVGKFMQEYKGYLILANIQGGVQVSQRIRWSDTNDPENWSTGNSGQRDLDEDGEDITGLGLFGDFVCVHKASSIYLGYLISSNRVFRFERKATEVGTVANASIVNTPRGEQVFLADDGIRIFNGATTRSASDRVNDEIRDQLNHAAKHRAWGVLVKERKEVWIGVPLGSDDNGRTVYRYNYETGAMHKDAYSSANAAWRATQSASDAWDDDPEAWDTDVTRWDDGQSGEGTANIHLGTTDGNTFIVDGNNPDDDSAAINCYWTSKDHELELSQLAKWQVCQVWAKGAGNLHFDYSYDMGDTWFEASNSPLALPDMFPMDNAPLKFWFTSLSTKVRGRFRLDGAGETVQLKQYALGYRPREFV